MTPPTYPTTDPVLSQIAQLRDRFLALSKSAGLAEVNMGNQKQFGAAASFAQLKEQAGALANLSNVLGTIATQVVHQHAEITAITKFVTENVVPKK